MAASLLFLLSLSLSLSLWQAGVWCGCRTDRCSHSAISWLIHAAWRVASSFIHCHYKDQMLRAIWCRTVKYPQLVLWCVFSRTLSLAKKRFWLFFQFPVFRLLTQPLLQGFTQLSRNTHLLHLARLHLSASISPDRIISACPPPAPLADTAKPTLFRSRSVW